jgi:hypothetical protein
MLVFAHNTLTYRLKENDTKLQTGGKLRRLGLTHSLNIYELLSQE